MSQTLRVLSLLRELPRGQGDDSTARRLAERLGVSERTLYRDLEVLQAAGFAVAHDDRGYHLLPTDQTAPSRLTTEEVAALIYAAQWAGAAIPQHVRQSVERALDKLAASVGTAEAARGGLEGSQGIAVEPPVTDGEAGVQSLLTAFQARRQCRKLRAVYQSPEDPRLVERLLHPYAVVYRGHAHYLVAFCELRQEDLTFRLDRFRSLELTEAPAEIPPRYDLRHHFAGAWEVTGGRRRRVRLLLRGLTARRLRTSQMHPSQRVLTDDGEALELEFRVAVTDEFRSWVLGLGPDATVLEPASLARSITTLASAIAANYRAT